MISIIISSYQENFFDVLTKNLEQTCGIKYEIIKIDNPRIMGVSKAYNIGISKAQYKYFLFLHEDVLFHTKNWGEKLIKHLDTAEVGLVGVAGSNYVPVVPCGWYVNNIQNHFMYLIQNSKDGNQPKMLNFMKKEKHQVYGVDGVFMGIKKEKLGRQLFNEKLNHFHGYDLDLSLNVSKKYKNYVISDILLEHFSLGGADKKCLEANIQVRKMQGSNHQKKINKKIELERFENFTYSYFRFFGINFISAFATLRFIPIGKIYLNDYVKLAKMYFKYFKYKEYYENRFN